MADTLPFSTIGGAKNNYNKDELRQTNRDLGSIKVMR